MRTRSAAFLVVLVALLGLAGCGVPGSSSPTRVAGAPEAGDPVNPAGAVRLPGRDGATNATELVERFLQAGAAADWDPDREVDKRIQAAANHAMQFLEPDQRKEWRPGNVILVVDATPKESLEGVTVDVVPVGVLEANGAVRPLRENEAGRTTLKFQTVNPNGTMLLSVAPGTPMPSNVMLSLTGLATLFEDRPVYFFDKSNQYLVPDRRYVNRGMSDEKRIRVIIKQWLSGPSDFLKNFVAPDQLPVLLDNPSLDRDRVTVNLQANQDDELRRIAAQIRWSVHRGSSSPAVEIQVNGRKQYEDTDNEFLELNPSQPRAGQAAPDEERLFAVMNGRVVAVSARANVPSILQSADYNVNVVLAAVHRTNNVAALVRRVDGDLELVLGHFDAEPSYQRVQFGFKPKTMSRPSFMPGTRGRVLLAVDGALYDVAPDGGYQLVQGVPATLGPVTAAAVAPDGARVAFVAGGRAVVAPLDLTAAVASIGTTVDLYAPNVVQALGVGWLYDDRVVVGGAAKMAEVAIDNGRVGKLEPENLAGSQLTQVSAVPGNPFDGIPGSVVVEAGSPQQAYYAFNSGLEKITRLPPPSPSPSASAGGGTGATATMSAPFYVDDVK